MTTEFDFLLYATPDKIIQTMRQNPSHLAYEMGKRSLDMIMDTQLSPGGADRIADAMADLRQAHHGWQLAKVIESGQVWDYREAPTRFNYRPLPTDY